MSLRSHVPAVTVAVALVFSAEASAVDEEFVRQCIAAAAKTADDEVTIGKLRADCIKQALFAEQYPIERRAAIERKTAAEPLLRTISV